MQKILFLDIDGVLNTALWYGPKDNKAPKDKWGYTFDPMSVANLKRIVDETGAEIVISSSWKCIGLPMLRRMWKARKLPGRIIDATPDCMCDEGMLNMDVDFDLIDIGASRGYEIREWLSRHGEQVSHYAILDDMYEMLPEQQSHLVMTDSETGITDEDADRVIEILNS